jgi:hypothetical protein
MSRAVGTLAFASNAKTAAQFKPRRRPPKAHRLHGHEADPELCPAVPAHHLGNRTMRCAAAQPRAGVDFPAGRTAVPKGVPASDYATLR